MLLQREQADLFMEKKLMSSVGNKKKLIEYTKELSEKYNFSEGVAADFLTCRVNISTANNFELFCLMDIIAGNTFLETYFTSNEIKEYRNKKIVVEKVKLPITLNLIEIADDQWIGKISVKELMKFRDAQLINYNEKTQRTMSHFTRDNIEYYKLSLNKKQVADIQKSYQTETYIPNTITLNLPQEADYEYNESSSTLIIEDIEHFDILDGYHRYVAISNEYNQNPNFDYTMELRVTAFNESKAQQFIWQEDQKTQMSVVDSKSYNQSNYGNKIVHNLNMDSACNLQGQITKNEGLINAPILSEAINSIYLSDVKEKDLRRKSIEITEELINKINTLTKLKPNLLSEKWKRKYIICTIYVFKNCNEFNKESMLDIDYLYDALSENKNKLIFSYKQILKKDLTKLSKIYEERR